MYGNTSTDIDLSIYSQNMLGITSQEDLISLADNLPVENEKIFVVMFPYSKNHGNCFLWISNAKPCLLLSFDFLDQQSIQYLNFSLEHHIILASKDDVFLLKNLVGSQIQTRTIKESLLDVNKLFKDIDNQLSLF